MIGSPISLAELSEYSSQITFITCFSNFHLPSPQKPKINIHPIKTLIRTTPQ